MLQASLLGGLFIGILSALPLVNWGNCCCLWILSGGLLAAYLDQQNDPRPTTLGRGARAGFAAGIIGALVWLIVSAALDPVLGPVQQRVMTELIRITPDMPPDARAALESVGESSPLGYAFDFLIYLFLGAIFSTLGGVVGAAFFRKDVPPALGGPIHPPPMPPQ